MERRHQRIVVSRSTHIVANKERKVKPIKIEAPEIILEQVDASPRQEYRPEQVEMGEFTIEREKLEIHLRTISKQISEMKQDHSYVEEKVY